MSFVNPQVLQRIMGGAQQFGQTLGAAPQSQQEQLWQMLAGAGAGMSQAAGQPGAGFAQALGGGAQGMMQGQQQAQQMQMGQLQMQRAKQEMERQERISKILGDILGGTGGRKDDWASRVDATLPQTPQLGQPGPAQATPYRGPGAISARYESGDGGVGTVSTGRGDPGGQSYGRHQLSSNAGTMGNFLQSPEGQPFAEALGGHAPGTPEFNQAYQALVQQAGPQMEQAQQQYLERTHVQPVLQTAQTLGLPVDNPGVMEALYSQAIQHSGTGNTSILRDAAQRLPENPTPEQVIDALYDAREPYALAALQRDGASEDVIAGVKNRYASERQAAKQAMQVERRVEPQLGGPLGGQQPQQAPQAMQPPQNGYQQPQQAGADPIANLPDSTRQLLALMDPDDALKTLVSMQTGGGDTPDRIQEAHLIAQETGEPVGQVLARMRGITGEDDDGLTTATRTTLQKAELFGRADPSLSESDRLNLALRRNQIIVDPDTGRASVVDIHTGETIRPTTQAAYEAQESGPVSDVDVSLAFGAPAVLSNVINTISDVFGADLPRPEVERAIRRVTSLGIQGDVLLSEQFTGRVSNQLLDMIGELKAKPKTFFEGPARGKTSLEEMSRLITRDLDRERRLANDETQGSATRRAARDAVEALTDYKRELDGVLESWGSLGGTGVPGAPADDDLDARMRRYLEQ
jgi:hypothetical protein